MGANVHTFQNFHKLMAHLQACEDEDTWLALLPGYLRTTYHYVVSMTMMT
jgi:hypothetical protein